MYFNTLLSCSSVILICFLCSRTFELNKWRRWSHYKRVLFVRSSGGTEVYTEGHGAALSDRSSGSVLGRGVRDHRRRVLQWSLPCRVP